MQDDGGPAFPNYAASKYRDGMTLRDYFAAQALAGVGVWTPMMACGTLRFLTDADGMQARAEWAYAQADAMLAVREGKADAG